MKIAVIGAGGVGGYFAGLLARGGCRVSLLARGAHLAAIRARGLEVRTPDDHWTAMVDAGEDAAHMARQFGGTDLVIVAVKSYSLAEVSPAVVAFAERGATVLPLLNGVDIAERLQASGVEPARIVGGLTYLSAFRIAPGIIERRSSFQRVLIGELDGRRSDRTHAIATALRAAGADGSAVDDVSMELWRKFAFIATLAAACGLARSPVGPVRATATGRDMLTGGVREIGAVARARGIPFTVDEEDRTLAAIEALPPGMKPSLLVDLEAGSRTEVEVLSGAVVRMAGEAGSMCPCIVPLPRHLAA